MKIGTSLGKCLVSILDGDVHERDVLMIVTGTLSVTRESFLEVVTMYHSGSHSGIRGYDFKNHSLDDALSLAGYLYDSGKIHQPRNFGGHPIGNIGTWLDVVPTPKTSDANVIAAYEQYQLLATLVK